MPMDLDELLRQWSDRTLENSALKAEVAGLKARLVDAHDKIASLQQFLEGETHMRRTAQAALEAANSAADCALKAQESTRSMLEHFQGEAETFRKELMRRGADDPRKPKPPCDTALAALQAVCKWDRDACLDDLRKQRRVHLRRIRMLKSGSRLAMDDVVRDMNHTEDFPSILADFDMNLHEVLGGLKGQLTKIWEDLPDKRSHEQWSLGPLSTFMEDPEYSGHSSRFLESLSDDDMGEEGDDGDDTENEELI